MAPTCFGLRPSSGSFQLNLAKVMLLLKHSVKLCRYLLYGVFLLRTAHSTHAILGHAATPPNDK